MFDHVISDTHFLHKKIVEYEPMRKAWGADSEEMTRKMVEAWRAVVRPEHTVLHCGDFAMGEKARWPELRASLPGKIVIARGNHDPTKWRHWEFLQPMTIVEGIWHFMDPVLGDVAVTHDPHDFTENDYRGSDLLLHGHLHSNAHRGDTPEGIKAKAVCVSVEQLPTAPAPMAWAEFQRRALRKVGKEEP